MGVDILAGKDAVLLILSSFKQKEYGDGKVENEFRVGVSVLRRESPSEGSSRDFDMCLIKLEDVANKLFQFEDDINKVLKWLTEYFLSCEDFKDVTDGLTLVPMMYEGQNISVSYGDSMRTLVDNVLDDFLYYDNGYKSLEPHLLVMDAFSMYLTPEQVYGSGGHFIIDILERDNIYDTNRLFSHIICCISELCDGRDVDDSAEVFKIGRVVSKSTLLELESATGISFCGDLSKFKYSSAGVENLICDVVGKSELRTLLQRRSESDISYLKGLLYGLLYGLDWGI